MDITSESDKKRPRTIEMVASLDKVVEKHIQTLATIVIDKKQLLRIMHANTSIVYGALHSKIGKGKDTLMLFSRTLKDDSNKPLLYIRDETQKIVGITNEAKTEKVDDLQLMTVFRFVANAHLDDEKLIFLVAGTGNVMRWPAMEVIEEIVDVKAKDGSVTKSPRWTLIQRNLAKKIWTPALLLIQFFSLDFVPVTKFKALGDAVNNCHGAIRTLDVGDYDTLEKNTTISSDSAKSSYEHALAGVLIGCALDNATEEDKVKAFVASPSIPLGSTLQLKQPQTGLVVNAGTGSGIKAVTLSSLKDDDLVVMSKVNISGSFWHNSNDINTVEVFRDQPNLANFKKGKAVKYRAQEFPKMSAKLLKSIINAIITSKKNSGSASSVVTKDAPIDFTNLSFLQP